MYVFLFCQPQKNKTMENDTKIISRPPETETEIQKAILLAFTYAGHNKDAETVMLISSAVMSWLDMPGRHGGLGMGMKDCVEGIRRGVFGEFGEYSNISAVRVVDWLKKYKYSRERYENRRETNPERMLANTSTKIPEEIKIEDFAIIQAAIDKFKSTGTFHDFGNIVYEKLRQYGYLSMDEVIWNKAKELAEKAKIIEKQNSSRLGELLTKRVSEMTNNGIEKYLIRHQVVLMWLRGEIGIEFK